MRFISLESEALSSAGELVIELKQPEVATFALEVTLLLNGLADRLRVRCGSDPMMTLTILPDDGARAIVTRGPDGARKFALPRNLGGYLQAVLLRAYRDQSAEVNHIHIEGEDADAPFDLTVMFDVYCPPMSPEEAKKLMDID